MKDPEKQQGRRGFLAAMIALLGGFFSGEWWGRRRGVTRWSIPSQPGEIPRMPGDLYPGYNFAGGEQVTTEKLQALIGDSLLRPTSITRRPVLREGDGTEQMLVQKDGALWSMPLSASRKLLATIDVREHGAKGDGVTNDAPAINSAIATASKADGGQLVFPAGVFRCDNQINLANKVSLHGAGEGASVLDFSHATLHVACMNGEGAIVGLHGLGAAVRQGARSLTFTGLHGLVVGDIVLITDTRRESYSMPSTAYRQGEAVRVSRVISGTHVEIATALYSGYAAVREVTLHKLDPINTSVRGFRIKCRPEVHRAGIRLRYGSGIVLADLDMTGSRYAHVLLLRCYESAVRNVRAVDYQDFPIDHGLNYGLLVASCQRLSVSDCFFETTRHGSATGTDHLAAAIVNREMAFTNCHIGSRGDSWGMDFHDNAEHWVVSNCALPNGIAISGDWGVLSGCTIGQDPATGRAIANRGHVGVNWEIINNIIVASQNYGVGIIQVAFRSGFSRAGSSLRISGNVIKSGRFHHPENASIFAPVIYLTAIAEAPEDLDATVLIEGNQVETELESAQLYGIAAVLTGKKLKALHVQNNVMNRCGIRIDNNVLNAVVSDNVVLDSCHRGIWLLASGIETEPRTRLIRGNEVLRSYHGNLTLSCGGETTITVEGNVSMEPRVSTAGPGDDSSCAITGAKMVIMRDNLFGHRTGTPTAIRGWVVRNVETLVKSGNIMVGTMRAPEVREQIGNEYGGWENVGTPREAYMSGPPRDGRWKVGDKVWNTTPDEGRYIGWVCITTGLPGQWRGFGKIAS